LTCNITDLFYSFTEAICDLLKINLSVVAGFVYSKITEAQKDQKELVVQVASRDLKSRMPEYELIRIIGILIDNALESTAPFGTAYLYLDSRQNQIEIGTRNKGSVKTNEFRQNMFSPGYTTKTGDRHGHGYGLYNLKKLTDKYNGKIYLDRETTYSSTSSYKDSKAPSGHQTRRRFFVFAIYYTYATLPAC